MNEGICLTGDGVGGDDLGDLVDHRTDVVATGLSATEQLDQRLGCRRLIDGSVVAGDDTFLLQAVDPAFHCRGGESHLRSNRCERCACSFLQMRNDLCVNGIHAQDSNAIRRIVVSTLVRSPDTLITPPNSEDPMNRYLMCRPEHFDVVSTINPWMDPSVPVSRTNALTQWESLVDTYERLGHQVDLVQPAAGLPDMVFAANAGVSIDNKMMAAVMWSQERRPEEAHYRKHFDTAGFDEVFIPEHINEGEGDFLFTGEVLLAGTGFRTDQRAHAEAQTFFDVEVVTLRLVDPRWYHLDTALFVINPELVVWFPGAFDRAAVAELRRRFPDGLEATEAEALAFGLNSTADDRHVVMPASAPSLAERVADAGFDVHTVDLSELLKAGGSVKCCTLELSTRT